MVWAFSRLRDGVQHSWLFAKNPLSAALALRSREYQRNLGDIRAFVTKLTAGMGEDAEGLSLMTHMQRGGWPADRLLCETILMVFGILFLCCTAI